MEKKKKKEADCIHVSCYTTDAAVHVSLVDYRNTKITQHVLKLKSVSLHNVQIGH